MDHKKVAKEVIEAVGRDNMVGAAHCATRLRLVLKDDDKIDQAALDNNPDVKGTFKTNGQYQIIIGPGDVNFVYDEIIKETGLKEASTEDLKKIAEQGQKFNPIMAFIKLLSDIFVPIIPALVAGGLLMALNNFLTSKGLFGPQAIVEMYPAIGGPCVTIPRQILSGWLNSLQHTVTICLLSVFVRGVNILCKIKLNFFEKISCFNMEVMLFYNS